MGEGEERISGSKGEADRPRLAEAMAAVRSGQVDTLIVTKLDRLGRSVRNVLEVCDELEALHCGLVVAEAASLSWLDSQNPMGRFMLQLFAALAELYRADYADRARRAQLAAKAAGKCIGRKAVLIPRPAVDWAWGQKLGGKSWAQIARQAVVEFGDSYRYTVSKWRRAMHVEKARLNLAQSSKHPEGTTQT